MELVEPIRDRDMVERMKTYLMERSPRDHCLFVLGVNSGLRVSDLIGLTCKDVMETRTRARTRIRLREKKTGKHKDFPIGATVRETVEAYMASRKGWGEDEYLFVSRKGNGHIERAQAYRIITEAAHHVGIEEHIGTHTLRKTFGYHAYKRTGDVALVQKLLNHSSPAITLAYIGITRDQMDDVYTGLEL